MNDLVDLFVYGSLMRHGRHHSELRGAEFRGETHTAPGYYVVQRGDYPALMAGGNESVHGEHYVVGPSVLGDLDAFEGPEYERRPLSLASGVTAQAYFARSDAED